MSTISLSILSYNTHLFGDLEMWKVADMFKGITYNDDQRCDQLKRSFLDANPRPVDLIALQEVWSSSYADDIKHHGKNSGNYPYFYCVNDTPGGFNHSGLILLGANGAVFQPDNCSYFSYIKSCNKDGFDAQDYPAGLGKLPPIPLLDEVSGKGYVYAALQLTSDFNPAIGTPITIGLFTTHMIVRSSSYPQSAACCFQSLQNAITTFGQNNPGAGILLAGDLNITWDANGGPSDDGFHTYVVPYLQTGAGLTNAYAQVNGNTPGYTIDNTNTLWQHFNPGGGTTQETIDYIFYKNSQDGTVAFNPTSGSVLNPSYSGFSKGDPLQVADLNNLDVSDHYPLLVSFNLTFS